MPEGLANYVSRFGGIGRLYGPKALERFRDAHVCIVGIGGVGSWTAEALARSGIGSLTLIDLDDICESNINRQIHALDGTIGASKIETMAARCRAINPSCQIHVEHAFFTADSAEALLHGGFDYLVDAIDSAKHKAGLLVACRDRKIPTVTVGGAGGRIDPTQIQVADLALTHGDPLLSRLRSILRSEHGFPRQERRKFRIECVFSAEIPQYPKSCDILGLDGEMLASSLRLDCGGGYGAVTHLTGTFGFVAASVVLKRLAAAAEASSELAP